MKLTLASLVVEAAVGEVVVKVRDGSSRLVMAAGISASAG